MSMFRNAVKIIKLRGIEKRLLRSQGDPAKKEEREAAKAELFQLVLSQRELKNLLEKYGKTEADLDGLYEDLCRCAGEPVKKRIFVPAEALVYRHSLKYVLENADGLRNSEERQKTVGWALSIYFKRNDILEVGEKRYLQEEEHEKNLKEKRAARRSTLDKKLQERQAKKARSV